MALDLKSYIAGIKNAIGYSVITKRLNVTANGTYCEDGKAYTPVSVNVQPTLQSKSVTENGTVTPDEGYDGLSSVNVAVPGSEPNLQSKSVSITANGSETVTADTGYDGLSEVDITTNVTPNLQDKTVTQNGTVTADDGYDGLDEVTVNVPSYPEPTGTKTITENGTGIDVKDYADVDVNVPMPDEYAIGGSLADKSLTGYKFKEGITSIGDYAFYGCTNLALTSLPTGVTSINTFAFSDCSNLALTSLPSGITSIGERSFQGCRNLALTSLPSGLTVIGRSCFLNCSKIAITSIPDGVTDILSETFRNCTSLTSMILPAGITTIGGYAFTSSLVAVTFKGTPNSIATSSFNAPTLRDIYVPWSEGEVANAPWGATNATIHYNYTPPTE